MPKPRLSWTVLLFGAMLLVAGPLWAEEGKSALSATKLSLPKGPGSIEGLGENAELNLVQGAATYRIPFSLPAGHAGFTPSLGLAYHSGAGNSVVGIGWSLSAPSIARMTSKGLPYYTRADLFGADGSDELVKVGGSPTLYRARSEGGFVKYTWTDYAGDGHFGYWTAELPNGTKRFFGANAKGKTVSESRTEGVGGTYVYNLVEEIDANGHSIRYAYTKDQGTSYLSAIEWVDGYWGPRYQVTLTYGQRPDALVDGKSGVEITLAKRLTDVRVMVKGQLLRHYYLQYEGDGLLSRLAYFWTYGSDDVSIYPARLAFKYSGSFDPTCEKQSTCNLPYIKTVTGSVGGGLANGNADLIDINGDGIPDVVDTTDGRHRFYLGRLDSKGNHSFDPPIDSKTSGSGAMSLKSPYVTMVDLNGDGFSDMVDTLNRRVLWGTGRTEWTPGALPDGILPDVSNPNARFLDTDHDGKIDSYYCDGSNAWVMRSDGTGHFEQGEILEPLDWSTSQGHACPLKAEIPSHMEPFRRALGVTV